MRHVAASRRIAVGLVLLFALLASGCSLIDEWLSGDEWRGPRVVKVTGAEKLCNYPPSWCVARRVGRPVGVLARDGDFFQGEKVGAFLYRESDGESWALDTQGDVVFLNGEAVSIGLSDEGTGWEWLRKASVKDLAHLRLLTLAIKKNAVDFSLLEKVARVRPHIGLVVVPPFGQKFNVNDLVVQKGLDRIARVVSLFEPELFLMIDSRVLSARFDVVAPKLTRLKQLVTTGEGPLDFLRRLPRLRSLAIVGPEKQEKIRDLSFLRNAVGLRELALWDVKGLSDITALAALPDLRKLDIAYVGIQNPDLTVLERLPGLAWLSFPLNTTQETFDKVIASHPSLEVIQLTADGVGVRDLTPLQSLPRLKAAIVLQKNIDVAPLHELKHLEYLALNKDAFQGNAAKKTEALEKALPDTFVAQAEPLCLGSGWILLLLPLIVLLRNPWRRGQGLGTEAHA